MKTLDDRHSDSRDSVDAAAARWKVHHQHDSQLGALDVLGVFVRAFGVSVVLDVLQALVCLGFRLQVRLLKEWLRNNC